VQTHVPALRVIASLKEAFRSVVRAGVRGLRRFACGAGLDEHLHWQYLSLALIRTSPLAVLVTSLNQNIFTGSTCH
jgi:hypothetical protein